LGDHELLPVKIPHTLISKMFKHIPKKKEKINNWASLIKWRFFIHLKLTSIKVSPNGSTRAGFMKTPYDIQVNIKPYN